jgi:nucleotide-binding universal stress UspA family protein
LEEEAGAPAEGEALKRILCAVDFSESSERAFSYGVQLASLNQGQIHLLHVIPRIVASVSGKPVTQSRWTAQEEEQAKAELNKLAKIAKANVKSVSVEVRIGDVDLQILDASNEWRADAIAIGTHGRKGFKRWIIGSVAERMLRYSPVPILIAGASRNSKPQPEFRRILVPVDFSPETSRMLAVATPIARRARASLSILHVIQNTSGEVDWETFPVATASVKQRLEELIQPAIRQEVKVQGRVLNGQPYKVILKAIKESKPSLVVLSTHGQGFIERVLIGSTADRVVRGGASMCPMLVVPPKQSKPSGAATRRRR